MKTTQLSHIALSFTVTIFLLIVGVSPSLAQTDTEFWLSVPYTTPAHGSPSEKSIVMSAGSKNATVTISVPANPSITAKVISIAANQTGTFDLSTWIN